MKKILAITTIMIMALMASVFALSENFALTSVKNDIRACPSSPDIADILTISNTGQITSSYTITLSGKASEWTTLSESSFSLESGESKDIFVYLRSDPSIEGNFELDIKVSTSFGLEKSYAKDIKIIKCNNLQVFPKIWYYDIAPCSTPTYEFEIWNIGEHLETYFIETTSKYTELSHNPAIIEPHQSQTVFIYAKPPCEVYGNQDFQIKVTALRSGFQAQFPLKLHIQPLYNYSIASQEQFIICTATDTQIPFTLNNKADMQNAYKLSIKAPRWMELDKKYPVIDANQSVELYINTSPKEEGDYNITLKAESLRGNLYLEKSLLVKARKCHELELKLPGEKDAVCAGSVKKYRFDVDNKGDSRSSIDIEINAPDWVTASEDNLNIKPNESKRVIVIANPPLDTTGKHNVEITVSIQNTTIKKTQNMEIQIISGKQCSAFEFLVPKIMSINNSEQILQIPVKNKGAMENNYSFAIDSPEFIKLQTQSLNLEPNEQGFIELSIKNNQDNNSTLEGTYEVLIQASTDDQAYSEVIKISIGDNNFLEFVQIYLLYIIVGIGVILIINGVLKLKEIKSKK